MIGCRMIAVCGALAGSHAASRWHTALAQEEQLQSRGGKEVKSVVVLGGAIGRHGSSVHSTGAW